MREELFPFSRPDILQAELLMPSLSFTSRVNLERDVALRRVANIDNHLSSDPDPSWALANLWKERGELHDQLGNWEDALQDLRTARTLFERQHDPRTASDVARSMAELLWRRGEWATALRLLEDEVLPVIESLGDIHSRALTMGQIADILREQGELEEALQIHEAQLPIFAKCGDHRARAITLDQIADIRAEQNNLEEALRIHEAQIQVFEQLGDSRFRALALGRIADIRQAQGEFALAMELYRELITTFERWNPDNAQARALQADL